MTGNEKFKFYLLSYRDAWLNRMVGQPSWSLVQLLNANGCYICTSPMPTTQHKIKSKRTGNTGLWHIQEAFFDDLNPYTQKCLKPPSFQLMKVIICLLLRCPNHWSLDTESYNLNPLQELSEHSRNKIKTPLLQRSPTNQGQSRFWNWLFCHVLLNQFVYKCANLKSTI